jgi:tRNA (mo5U34)-methyltransferase
MEEQAKTLEERIADFPFWYHRIELPDGIVTPGWSPLDAARYGVPADLTGKRILDIGAWDGYWTFEALKRGAKEVVAIDDFSDDLGSLKEGQRRGWETFDLCREAFGFKKVERDDKRPEYWENDEGQGVTRLEKSIYEINDPAHGYAPGFFDVVFLFGTIYHLRYPLLALDMISKVCDGSIYIETAAADDYSPYRGGLNKGYRDGDMVMEFYPGAQYGKNASNWWAPTLQCLVNMVTSAGFKDVDAWTLTDRPRQLSECRGFVSGTKDPAKEPANRPEGVRLADKKAMAKVAAVMSVPRLGFHDNMSCVFEAFSPLAVPIMKVQGAYWGQCLERGMLSVIDQGADIIVTVDYDTVFKREDVESLLNLMYEHPEAAAIASTQIGRGHYRMLMTARGRSGQVRKDIPLAEFEAETSKVATSHFGLTAIRVSDLMDLPHPWFIAKPDADGMWGSGRTDADIAFWRLMEQHGKTVLQANHVVVGHLELMVTWPDKSGKPIYQLPETYHKQGKAEGTWNSRQKQGNDQGDQKKEQ